MRRTLAKLERSIIVGAFRYSVRSRTSSNRLSTASTSPVSPGGPVEIREWCSTSPNWPRESSNPYAQSLNRPKSWPRRDWCFDFLRFTPEFFKIWLRQELTRQLAIPEPKGTSDDMFWNGTDRTVAVRGSSGEGEGEGYLCNTRYVALPRARLKKFHPVQINFLAKYRVPPATEIDFHFPLNVGPERCVQVALVPLALVRINFGKKVYYWR